MTIFITITIVLCGHTSTLNYHWHWLQVSYPAIWPYIWTSNMWKPVACWHTMHTLYDEHSLSGDVEWAKPAKILYWDSRRELLPLHFGLGPAVCTCAVSFVLAYFHEFASVNLSFAAFCQSSIFYWQLFQFLFTRHNVLRILWHFYFWGELEEY